MKLLAKLYLIIVLIIGTTLFATASAYLYDDSRGLSNSHINQINKDRTGLLWIATNYGLNTFDGYSFKEIPFFKKQVIQSIHYDSLEHKMWVGTDSGLFLLDIRKQILLPLHPLYSGKSVQYIYKFKNKLILQLQQGDILQQNGNDKPQILFSVTSISKAKNNFRKIRCVDDLGNLYLSIHDYPHLVRLNVYTGKYFIIKNIIAKDVWDVTTIDGKCVVACMRKGLVKLNDEYSDWIIDHTTHGEYKFSMIYKFKNEYYALMRGFYGVFQYSEINKKWILLEGDNDVSFRSKNVNTIWRDVHNVLWVGTNKGLIKMTLKSPDNFKTLFEGYQPFVSTRQIIQKNDQELFVATINGVYEYNLPKLKAKLIDSNEFDSVFPIYTRSLYYDGGQYLLSGTETQENFIYQINLSTNKCEGGFFSRNPHDVKVSSVYSMMKGRGQKVWLATDKGLAWYDKKLNKVQVFLDGVFNTNQTKLFYLAKSSFPGKFWAAGRSAFFLVDEINGVEQSFTVNHTLYRLKDDDYIYIGEDTDKKLWIGTKKSGIFILDFKNHTTEHITKTQGLSANEVYGVLWQNEHIGWISTVDGLCRYDVRTKTFNNYFLEDGLSDNEFNQNSLFKGADGLFYFGGINGINYFNPKSVQPISDKLTIFNASAVKWNENGQSFVAVNPEEPIRMNPQDHLLSFTFGLSDYSNVDGCSYYYKIKGLHNDWVSLGNQNVLRIDGLPADNYQIEVMGFNKRGIRSVNTLTYQLEIVQVFYKTWWFYVLLALAVIMLVYGYFKWRLQNIKQKLKLRTQIASNLHDEVGSLLTSIIISTDGARYGAATLEEKDQKLERISSLSREATNTMSDVLWSIDARNDFVGNLTDRMREQAEAMLMPLDIEIEFDLSLVDQQQNIAPEIRQQLYLIFKEAINNIAKHSEATLVKVYYNQQGKKFNLRIQNNKHTNIVPDSFAGQGLKNMQMRAKKIAARCDVYVKEDWFVVEVVND